MSTPLGRLRIVAESPDPKTSWEKCWKAALLLAVTEWRDVEFVFEGKRAIVHIDKLFPTIELFDGC